MDDNVHVIEFAFLRTGCETDPLRRPHERAPPIVICAGQEPRRELVAGLAQHQIDHMLVGGADVALELDAKRAIEQGTRVALAL